MRVTVAGNGPVIEAGLIVEVAAFPVNATLRVSVLRALDARFARFTAVRGCARRTADADDAAFALLVAFVVSAARAFLVDLVICRVAIEQITCGFALHAEDERLESHCKKLMQPNVEARSKLDNLPRCRVMPAADRRCLAESPHLRKKAPPRR